MRPIITVRGLLEALIAVLLTPLGALLGGLWLLIKPVVLALAGLAVLCAVLAVIDWLAGALSASIFVAILLACYAPAAWYQTPDDHPYRYRGSDYDDFY